jgi:hypothetical protein
MARIEKESKGFFTEYTDERPIVRMKKFSVVISISFSLCTFCGGSLLPDRDSVPEIVPPNKYREKIFLAVRG